MLSVLGFRFPQPGLHSFLGLRQHPQALTHLQGLETNRLWDTWMPCAPRIGSLLLGSKTFTSAQLRQAAAIVVGTGRGGSFTHSHATIEDLHWTP